jgi:hypothetical protein
MATQQVSSSAAGVPAPTVTRISYTNRDFQTALASLMAQVQATNPTLYSDFFESNLGQMFMEQFALVVDLLSMGQDSLANEIFLATCRRYESAIAFANSVGYVPAGAAAASVVVTSISLPAAVTTYGATIPALTVIKGLNGLQYELQALATIEPGATQAQLTLLEGQTYQESFNATNTPNQEVQTSNYIVQDQSWALYVGAVIPANLWTEVPNVTFQTGPTQTYDYYYDGNGAVHFRFGDGIAGAIPQQAITVVYRTTDGEAGNAPTGSIQGTLQATLMSPGTGTASITFLNQNVNAAATGGTQLQQNENEGNTVASAIQSGTTLFHPISSGSLVLVISLPGGHGTLTLQDNGAGAFSVTNNSTSPAVTLVSSAITYSTGVWSIQLSAAVVAGGSMIATYYSVTPPNPGATVYIGAATGGADRESLTQLRQNIPAYIRSQGKIITLQDYNDLLPTLQGVVLAFATKYVSSYTANAVLVNVWTSTEATVTVTDQDGTTSSQIYEQYAQISPAMISTIQNFLTGITLLTVHNVITVPAMLWVDLYLGEVTYDPTFTKQSVQQGILNAVIGVFENSTGFAIRLSDLYNAIRTVQGVTYFAVERIATGTQASSAEITGQTLASPTVSGTLLNPTIVPGSVQLTIEQTTGNTIVIADNESGGWVLVSGPVGTVINSGTINYVTGAFTVTFAATLVGNQPVIASYANVTADYRAMQNVNFNYGSNSDPWPPPGVPTSVPVVTPPFSDGVPLSATRIVLGVITPVTPPYQTGDLLTYAVVQDLVETPAGVSEAFYDNEYLFNNEIYYDSVLSSPSSLLAINLRNLIFNLVVQQ